MTGQNTSSAVMQQRVEPHDSLDDFPTPPWATRAICDKLDGLGFNLAMSDVREPCANRGHMVKPLRELFGHVMASDVFDYGAAFPVRDYLFGPADHLSMTDWTFMNPPFRLAEQFIARALERSRVGVAVLARSSFLEGEGRQRLFASPAPSYVFQHAERVVMLRGRLVRAGAPDPANIDPATGKPRKASTATSYAWIVWIKGEEDTRWRRIEKCRLRFEREGDYPA
ncbi:hypothetical protein [Novosphingobium sp. MBES04]|uniref:hypothetical protein n=1 Tax=Novosphingobium sp. MBES04 TaxID=1206458 RepID=UPI00057C69C5|nr:hypothetical protein [Novosphingobium sp. MBES04]GAM06310.1 methyltransferase [Novosphingobium sp. MBES04]